MALVVEKNFIDKYKNQFYNKDVSIQQLLHEQKQLFLILHDLNIKTDKFFDKACSIACKESDLSSSRKQNKQNGYKLPLIMEAQIRNSKSYRGLLQEENRKLQKKMERTLELQGKDVDSDIRNEKQRIVKILKENKSYKGDIKRLGEKLVDQRVSPEEIEKKLVYEIKLKRSDNQHKSEKVSENKQKIEQLRDKIGQIQKILVEKNENEAVSKEDRSQLTEIKENEKKYKTLVENQQKIKQNIQSIGNRLNQQYYSKLRQLQQTVYKVENIKQQIQKANSLIDSRNKQLNRLELGK